MILATWTCRGLPLPSAFAGVAPQLDKLLTLNVQNGQASMKQKNTCRLNPSALPLCQENTLLVQNPKHSANYILFCQPLAGAEAKIPDKDDFNERTRSALLGCFGRRNHCLYTPTQSHDKRSCACGFALGTSHVRSLWRIWGSVLKVLERGSGPLDTTCPYGA